MPAIVMYTKSWCSFCDMAKRLLTSKGQTWTEINIEREPDRRDEMIERSGRRTVPQIWIGDRHVGGFDDLAALEDAGAGPVDDLRLVVTRRVHLRLELARPGEADGFSVLDGAGEGLEIASFEGGGKQTRGRWKIHEGRTRVLAVSETARTVVLYRAEKEVRRVHVALRAGEVNVIRP